MISLTPAAQQKLRDLLSPNTWFRVTVSSGGCSGFTHSFSIASELGVEDIVFDGLLVCDAESLDLLGDVSLNYITNVVESKFELLIPSATSTCGCGKSFNI